jgi:hypothetical protein
VYGHYHLRRAGLIGSGHPRLLLLLLSLLAAASLWVGHTRLHQAPGGLPQQQLLASSTSSSSNAAATRPLAAGERACASVDAQGLDVRGGSSSAVSLGLSAHAGTTAPHPTEPGHSHTIPVGKQALAGLLGRGSRSSSSSAPPSPQQPGAAGARMRIPTIIHQVCGHTGAAAPPLHAMCIVC